MQLKLLGSLCVVCLMGTSLFAQERTWTDDKGKFSIDAELVKVEGKKVFLKKTDGDVIKVPINRLSDADQKFVASWKSDSSEGDEAETGWLEDVKVKATAKRQPGFDYDFNSNDPMPEIDIDVEILGKAAKQAISYGKLKLESFKDADGNELKMPEEKFGPDITEEMEKVTTRGNDFMSEHPKNGIRVSIKTMDKAGKVSKVAEVKGQIELLTGGTSKIVTIEDVSGHAVGNIESDVLNELGIKCDFQREGQQIQLKVEGDVSTLASVSFVDGKGKTVEPQGWSSGGWKKSWQYSYDFDDIPKANLVMDFRLNPETVTLPFHAKNIKVKNR